MNDSSAKRDWKADARIQEDAVVGEMLKAAAIPTAIEANARRNAFG